MDNWIAATLRALLRDAPDPLVVDLGYGATPITAIELRTRLSRIRPDVRVLGLEIDPERVATALPSAQPPLLEFARGGFELAGTRPVLVRAANVLRQYDEQAAARAWDELRSRIAPGGRIVEGTCDELGRLGGWVLLDAGGPRTLTLSCRVELLDRPATLAERLPKALIHHNVPGQHVHRFVRDLDSAWDASAPLTAFGPRQRWIAACRALAPHWPVDVSRSRYGEITVAWDAVAPG